MAIHVKFSVLMSIYHKENPQDFDRAMRSVWDEQTIKPNEIVLVEDGVLTDELYQSIGGWKDKLGDIFKIISLEKNAGLGNALNVGLDQCSFDLIARMDTDDISLPNRFEVQLEIFKNNNIDICGAWVGEFESDETQIASYRKVPEQHNEIIKFAKSRSPVNHPAVMYKRKSVSSVGNYDTQRLTEDYNLWVKLILNGAKFYNTQGSLVSMRVGNGQVGRRGGLKNAILEVAVQKEFYKMGFLNSYELFRNVVIGFTIRLLPKTLLKAVFKIIRKL
ncbi:Putative glycosyltransferase [uncultured Gammaproteobacteria bacterium]|jgi:glycosyltransferase involved in cell wall biosynthesis|nr:Putative glycosyltransferase [uncultured Gammaproteobacteria bacterium]VVM17408.1 putative glycosyltransferase [uncultured Gammaproteobacteria bacterium]